MIGQIQTSTAPWAIAVGACIGLGIAVYVISVRKRTVRIVLASERLTVAGFGAEDLTIETSNVGWIELARGSTGRQMSTQGAVGEGHVDLYDRSGRRQTTLSNDYFGLNDAIVIAQTIGVPLIMTRFGDSRRWWWDGREWIQATEAAPPSLITEVPAPPVTFRFRELKVRTIVIVALVLLVLAVPLFGPLVVSLLRGH